MAEKLYPYAVGRIRVVEKKLLDKNKLDTLSSSKNVGEALKILEEVDYGYERVEARNYEKMLSDELSKAYRLLKSLAPTEDVFDIFLLKNDYHNAKVCLKSELTNKVGDGFIFPVGSISNLQEFIRERDYKNMPPEMAQAVSEAAESYNKTKNPQLIDIILDRAAFAHMKRAAVSEKNEFILRLIVKMIDTANIKAFLRVRKTGQGADFLGKVLSEHGSYEINRFLRALEVQNDGLSAWFPAYAALIDVALNKGFTVFEKMADDMLTEYVKKAKYMPLTIEPLIGYLIAKEMEIKSVRIVMVGLINNIDAETISERVRNSYV